MLEDFDPEVIQDLARTARSAGAVGQRETVVTKWTRKLGYSGLDILDFGSGTPPQQTEILQSKGLNVTPFDFNLNEELLDERPNFFDIVMVSNVINVQPDMFHLSLTMDMVSGFVRRYGFVLINYPKSPRKMEDLRPARLERLLEEYFSWVEQLPDRTLIYKCHP